MSKSLAAVLSALLLTACLQGPPEVGESDAPLYDLSTVRWSGGWVPVCWESASTDPVARAWVRDSVERTWAQNAAVTFEGWGICSSASKGVRIKVSDERAHAVVLGNQLDGRSGGLVLNFTYQNWSQACAAPAAYEDCIRVDAVHEFGHVLGFSHEQNRPDTPDTCTDAPQGENGDWIIGPFDTDSIMNYCNGFYKARHWPWNMSAEDIRGVQQVYGRRAGHSFVGHGGHCLDVAGGQAIPGAYLQTWDCNGGAGQSWDPPFSYGPFVSNLGACVFGTAIGGYPTMDSCLSPPSWSFSSLTIRGLGGKCLTLDDATGPTGSGLQLMSCTSNTDQRFHLVGQQLVTANGRCLRGLLGLGGAVTLGSCSDPYEWTMRSGGIIQHSDGLCISLENPDPVSHSAVILDHCRGVLEQEFNLTGFITVAGGGCLQIRTDTTLPVTPVDVDTCRSGTADENQLWDYYW